ncbi:complement factor H-like isoform X2 [Harmonia axyridis]|uniref:complement factor H-like isoform X2 n=1 Tax=Harmonia axyridis TaxID=115357 RepID=UPI001E279099|nr:complement factor H-like isoform X2 [Harmonia axyridis]
MTFYQHGFGWFHILSLEFFYIYSASGNIPIALNITEECFDVIEKANLKFFGRRAIVECQEGYDLEGPSNIECVDGQWNHKPRCVPRCLEPPPLGNGTRTISQPIDFQGLHPKGTLATYVCSEGFYLYPASSKLRVCEEGIWTGSDAKCFKYHNSFTGCMRPQEIMNGYYVFEKHGQLDPFDVGQRIHYSCREGYILDGSSVQQCLENGDWSPKIQPTCWKPTIGPSSGCPSPPSVDYASVAIISGFKNTIGFPPKTQVSYECVSDYILEGTGVLTCLEGGCWYPSMPPSCISATYDTEYNPLNAFLISLVTGTVVLSSLLVICLLVIYRRKRQILRELTIPPPAQGPDMGDHTILLHQPDRLALIAFADGMHGQRNSLPTYDEAVRDRPPNYSSSGRLPPRPHWQHITGRRNRNSPNSDMLHNGRHGSFVSHTPSTRSAGDSMGSTDTVAISENSTNVTLDTVSSYSGSQAPSCRAHCGSLASFDTCSVIITEDVPLLEESELEEIPVCDTISLIVECPTIQENASIKNSGSTAEVS